MIISVHRAFKSPHAQTTNICKMKVKLCYYGNNTHNKRSEHNFMDQCST